MISFDYFAELFFGFFLILSSLGVILAKKPIYASLSFLITLLTLAGLYLVLSAEFIAVMQVLVYAGAILVIFIFVIVLFQDAHQQISLYPTKSNSWLLVIAAVGLVGAFVLFGKRLEGLTPIKREISADFGDVEPLGKLLYVDFFFPFEALILIFLIAMVGSIYIARKAR